MTRINLIPVEELTDQHLFTEWRELPRIFTNVRKAIKAGKTPHNFKIPTKFVLGTGHMTFFYNKLLFLRKRHDEIIDEICNRGSHELSTYESISLEGYPSVWLKDYVPNTDEIELSRSRIKEKLDMKKDIKFYTFWGKYINDRS